MFNCIYFSANDNYYKNSGKGKIHNKIWSLKSSANYANCPLFHVVLPSYH